MELRSRCVSSELLECIVIYKTLHVDSCSVPSRGESVVVVVGWWALGAGMVWVLDSCIARLSATRVIVDEQEDSSNIL